MASEFLNNFDLKYSQNCLKPSEVTYVDNTQSRLEEQFDNLHWASRWEKEWRDIMAHPRQTQQDTLLWEEGEEAIWARTVWRGQTYLFGLHKRDMLTHLAEMAKTETLRDGLVSMQLLPPDSIVPTEQILVDTFHGSMVGLCLYVLKMYLIWKSSLHCDVVQNQV